MRMKQLCSTTVVLIFIAAILQCRKGVPNSADSSAGGQYEQVPDSLAYSHQLPVKDLPSVTKPLRLFNSAELNRKQIGQIQFFTMVDVMAIDGRVVTIEGRQGHMVRIKHNWNGVPQGWVFDMDIGFPNRFNPVRESTPEAFELSYEGYNPSYILERDGTFAYTYDVWPDLCPEGDHEKICEPKDIHKIRCYNTGETHNILRRKDTGAEYLKCEGTGEVFKYRDVYWFKPRNISPVFPEMVFMRRVDNHFLQFPN